MKNYSMAHRSGRGYFRSVDEWKSALMTLPDNSFFELLRSVLGNIRTPFNKQRLLNDLFNILSKNEIQETITAYINEQDHKVIAAVALLHEPAPGTLESFFSGELNYAELHSLLINLEERLIVYRFRKEEGLCLALNPVLEPVLAPFVEDTRLLFPCFAASADIPLDTAKPQSCRKADCVSDGRILAALFAFMNGEEELLKAEGGIRKKILEEGKKFFPELDLELIIRTMLLLGLFRQSAGAQLTEARDISTGRPQEPDEEGFLPESRCIVPSRKKIADFGGLDPAERQEYWAAGVYLCLYGSEQEQGYNFRYRVRKIAAHIRRFRILLDAEKLYPEITLRRLTELFLRDDGDALAFPGQGLRLSFVPLLTVMEYTGLMEREGAYWKPIPVPAAEDNTREAAPLIAMDTAFSFVIYPEIPFAAAQALAVFCSVKETSLQKKHGASRKGSKAAGKEHRAASETVVSFELTRQSVIRGFDQGMKADDIINLLDRLSLNRIDAHLRWTVKEWESRYDGVSLHQGIIMTLAEERRYLTGAEPVASLIRKTLAPGVYLLSSEDRSGAARALRKAGVDIIALPSIQDEADWPANSFPRLESGNSLSPPGFPSAETNGPLPRPEPSPPSGAVPQDGAPPFNKGGAIQEKFRQVLEKMKLTKQERDELSARIDRRLVLSEAQLEGASLRYEKLEAMGLDYAGKSLIAKQALQSGFLVELSWPGSGGENNKVIGLVQSMEKKEGESILVLRPAGSGEEEASGDVHNPGNTIRIPLVKISHLRRIKQSIFGE